MRQAKFLEAGDGVEALGVIATSGSAPDLILSDWNMPNMDGLMFTTRFREHNKTTPLIMVTTEVETVEIIEAVRAGANNYVVKPFTPEVLLDRVKRTLAALKKQPAPVGAA